MCEPDESLVPWRKKRCSVKSPDSVRILFFVAYGVLALVEQVGAACGYLIECKYVYHVMLSFDQAFSASNFFMNSTSFSTPSIGIAL